MASWWLAVPELSSELD